VVFSPKRVGFAVVCLSLMAAGIIVWYAGLRGRFFPINFGVVEPGRLYRSGQISHYVIRRTLEDNHIGMIIDLSSRHEATPDAKAERATAHELGIERINLTLLGNGTGDPSIYPKVIEDIVQANRQGKAVLVHCQSGAQRTGGIVAAYRILIEGEAPDQAFTEMERYGHSPHSNPKLIPFIRQHLDEWKATLARDHAADTEAATARR